MIHKQILDPQRIRRIPAQGFSWIDRRFLRQHAADLSHDALLLYFFLAAVADQHGLSFWSDVCTAVRLRLSEPQVVQARQELLTHDLIAFRSPLTQVLSLPEPHAVRGGPLQLGAWFRSLAQT